MRDHRRCYRALQEAVTQCSPGEPQGNVARHLTTLAALLSGIVTSKRTPLPNIASHVPDGTTPESRVKRFARWVGNDTSTADGYFFPSAEVLLAHGALQTLGLVIDGSVGGRGGIALMLPVVYTGRALPLAWQVREGKTGHCPEARHLAVVEQVQALLPENASGVLLGDGACDGPGLQHTMANAGWSSVGRTGGHMTASWQGATFRLDTIGACLKPGTRVDFTEGLCTGKA
jgi:hypothetical protein